MVQERANENSNISIMVSLIDILRQNGAVIQDGHVVMTCIEISKAADEYAHDSVESELQSLLDTHSTQAYWPAIIKQRINKLKGRNNG
jgi:hypothetical protein